MAIDPSIVAVVFRLPCEHNNFHIESRYCKEFTERRYRCADCGLLWEPDWVNWNAFHHRINYSSPLADIANQIIYFTA